MDKYKVLAQRHQKQLFSSEYVEQRGYNPQYMAHALVRQTMRVAMYLQNVTVVLGGAEYHGIINGEDYVAYIDEVVRLMNDRQFVEFALQDTTLDVPGQPSFAFDLTHFIPFTTVNYNKYFEQKERYVKTEAPVQQRNQPTNNPSEEFCLIDVRDERTEAAIKRDFTNFVDTVMSIGLPREIPNFAHQQFEPAPWLVWDDVYAHYNESNALPTAHDEQGQRRAQQHAERRREDWRTLPQSRAAAEPSPSLVPSDAVNLADRLEEIAKGHVRLHFRPNLTAVQAHALISFVVRSSIVTIT